MHKISIIPRGRALGYTLVLPTEDRLLRSRRELEDEMAMLLGGRTAEELVFDDPTTGAHDDIDRATEIARRMVTEFGMSDLLGPIRFVGPNEEVFVGRDMGHAPEYSQSVAARIDDEIRRLVDGAHTAARTILADAPRRARGPLVGAAGAGIARRGRSRGIARGRREMARRASSGVSPGSRRFERTGRVG